jgi:hypothetical protein
MKEKLPLSLARKTTVISLIASAAGVVIQIVSGADYPKVPPVFFILLIPAGLIAFGQWGWTPVIAILGGLFLIFGLFSSGASVRLFHLTRFGVSAGLWIQMLGVVVATIAGIITIVENYRIRTT